MLTKWIVFGFPRKTNVDKKEYYHFRLLYFVDISSYTYSNYIFKHTCTCKFFAITFLIIPKFNVFIVKTFK